MPVSRRPELERESGKPQPHPAAAVSVAVPSPTAELGRPAGCSGPCTATEAGASTRGAGTCGGCTSCVAGLATYTQDWVPPSLAHCGARLHHRLEVCANIADDHSRHGHRDVPYEGVGRIEGVRGCRLPALSQGLRNGAAIAIGSHRLEAQSLADSGRVGPAAEFVEHPDLGFAKSRSQGPLELLLMVAKQAAALDGQQVKVGAGKLIVAPPIQGFRLILPRSDGIRAVLLQLAAFALVSGKKIAAFDEFGGTRSLIRWQCGKGDAARDQRSTQASTRENGTSRRGGESGPAKAPVRKYPGVAEGALDATTPDNLGATSFAATFCCDLAITNAPLGLPAPSPGSHRSERASSASTVTVGERLAAQPDQLLVGLVTIVGKLLVIPHLLTTDLFRQIPEEVVAILPPQTQRRPSRLGRLVQGAAQGNGDTALDVHGENDAFTSPDLKAGLPRLGNECDHVAPGRMPYLEQPRCRSVSVLAGALQGAPRTGRHSLPAARGRVPSEFLCDLGLPLLVKLPHDLVMPDTRRDGLPELQLSKAGDDLVLQLGVMAADRLTGLDIDQRKDEMEVVRAGRAVRAGLGVLDTDPWSGRADAVSFEKQIQDQPRRPVMLLLWGAFRMDDAPHRSRIGCGETTQEGHGESQVEGNPLRQVLADQNPRVGIIAGEMPGKAVTTCEVGLDDHSGTLNAILIASSTRRYSASIAVSEARAAGVAPLTFMARAIWLSSDPCRPSSAMSRRSSTTSKEGAAGCDLRTGSPRSAWIAHRTSSPRVTPSSAARAANASEVALDTFVATVSENSLVIVMVSEAAFRGDDQCSPALVWVGRREVLLPRQDQVGRTGGKLGKTGPITITGEAYAESMLKMISVVSVHRQNSRQLQRHDHADDQLRVQRHLQFQHLPQRELQASDEVHLLSSVSGWPLDAATDGAVS